LAQNHPHVDQVLSQSRKTQKNIASGAALARFSSIIFHCAYDGLSTAGGAKQSYGRTAMRIKLLAITALVASGGIVTVFFAQSLSTSSAQTQTEAEAIVDATGNLRVPDNYRTIYRFLGSWAVAAEHGQGSKELHVVYASPGVLMAYRKDGRFQRPPCRQ
jgi:hypothetical protein